MKDINNILIAPVITEKVSAQKSEKKYGFKVSMDSNKIEVKKAIETLYKVKVDKVNMVIVTPKMKRVRTSYGYSDQWKKAIVTLSEGEIDVYKV
jgi:large subunit ribosomal protein L23